MRIPLAVSIILLATTSVRADAISTAAIANYAALESANNFNQYANNPDGGTLGWGESYVLMGAAAMYEATGDSRHLKRVLDHADQVLANRADRRNVRDDVRNKLVPAWTTGTYTNGVNYAWEVHAGMVTAPIARAAYLAKKNPTLAATEASRVDRQIADLIATAVGFESDWREGPKQGEGYYREQYLNATSPYNQMNAMGRLYVNLYLVTGQQRFRERATKLANFFKDDLRQIGSGTSARYDWAYSTTSSGSEDLSHAAINADFAFQCYRAGIVFDATDMQRFSNTYLAMSRGASGFTHTVAGTGAADARSDLAGLWGELGYVNPAVRTAYYDYYQSHATQGIFSTAGLHAAYLAATAQPFAFESPLPQPARLRVAAGFEPTEGYFSPGTPGPRSAGFVPADTSWRFAGPVAQGRSAVQLTVAASGRSAWTLELPAGTGTAGQPLVLDRAGYVGLWLRTTTPGLTASPVFDDLGALERGTPQPLIPDGQWRLYQWNLDDAVQWDALLNGNGSLEGLVVTLQSLLFTGTTSAVVSADLLQTNTSGPIAIPEPSSVAALGVLSSTCVGRRRRRH